MDATTVTWLWAAAGVALLASELFAPGLIAAFLGAGALTVAGARALGLVEGHVASLVLWGASSTLYVLVLRSALLRAFGEGTRTLGSTDEDVRAYGAVVEVVEAIPSEEQPGRVRWDGTTWPAVSTGPALPAGSHARLVARDNLAWVVEPVSRDTPLSPALPPAPPAPSRLGGGGTP